MKSSRKELKGKAKNVLKKHYLMLVIICLVASLVGTSLDNSLGFARFKETKIKENLSEPFDTSLSSIVKKIEQSSSTQVFEHKEGVFASVINGFSSGSFFLRIVQGIEHIVKSPSLSLFIFILLSTFLIFAFWFFITNSFIVVQARMFLESRIYDKLPLTRMTFLFKTKRFIKSCFTIFLETFYLILWFFTIIGGFIKIYAYALVPYIVAENPDIKARDALKLSNEMMRGHKWELFLIDLSFIGWELLSILTLNITKILYSSPYKTATYCEFYVKIRSEAKKEKNISDIYLLDDNYLYQKASKKDLKETYSDILKKVEELKVYEYEPRTLKENIYDFLGIASKNTKKEKNYELKQSKLADIKTIKDELEGKTYPTRLFKLEHKRFKLKKENLNYMRRYRLSSLFLIFICASFIGWIWEVSFHFVTDGMFVNRGVQYGPWLPIYGTGSVLILTVLNKLRQKPVWGFFTTILICGIVEYFTSYYLEVMNNGIRWWDYSGYFLNLHGRICAEGLLVFGIGGFALVYFIAPFLDNTFKKVKKKKIYVICSILFVLFMCDKIYSIKYPNVGKGITDYRSDNVYEKSVILLK